jgi:hypothetical protein
MKPYLYKSLVFLIAVTILTVEFYNNAFQTVDQPFFETFQRDSESLTVGRLARSKKDGAFSYGGFPGWNHPDISLLSRHSLPRDNRFVGWGYEVPGHPDKFLFQYEALEDSLKIDHYEEYFSMSGGQAFLYHVLGGVTNTTGNTLVALGQFLNALFTAVLLCAFLWWAYKYYGKPAAIIGFILLLFSQWLIVFARNMQYVTGLFFLPFIINLWLLHKAPVRTICLLTFAAVLLKCVIAGFDFILPTLLMAVLPILFYAVVYKWTQRPTIYLLTVVSLSALAAVALSLFILLLQLALYYHSWPEAWEYVIATGERRTLGANAADHISLRDLYRLYANGPAIHLFRFQIRFQTFFGISLLATALGLLRHQQNRPLVGLLIVTWMAMAGPFSWFIIFKDHSIHHTHMDYIVWYMPYMLFAGVLIAYVGYQGILWIFDRMPR